MTKLSDKIKTALDEGRMLVLGTQILLGFQYRAFFEPGYEQLPRVSQYLKLVGLAILLLAIALVMWPSSYHRIVRNGNDSPDVHEFTTRVMDLALFPLAVALALDFYILTGRVIGAAAGIMAATVIGAIALFAWFAYPLINRQRKSRSQSAQRDSKTQETEMENTPIHQKVEQVLTEARLVLPGAQALLGFQFATILLEAFEKLPASSKYVHLISLALMGVTVILLMTPAAYHRIVERGEDTKSFHDVASKLLLGAMLVLPIGMCGDMFVVMRKVTGRNLASLIGSLIALAFFYSLWFGFTTYRKRTTA